MGLQIHNGALLATSGGLANNCCCGGCPGISSTLASILLDCGCIVETGFTASDLFTDIGINDSYVSVAQYPAAPLDCWWSTSFTDGLRFQQQRDNTDTTCSTFVSTITPNLQIDIGKISGNYHVLVWSSVTGTDLCPGFGCLLLFFYGIGPSLATAIHNTVACSATSNDTTLDDPFIEFLFGAPTNFTAVAHGGTATLISHPHGACCQAPHNCSIQTQAACIYVTGTYQGDATTCTPNPC